MVLLLTVLCTFRLAIGAIVFTKRKRWGDLFRVIVFNNGSAIIESKLFSYAAGGSYWSRTSDTFKTQLEAENEADALYFQHKQRQVKKIIE